MAAPTAGSVRLRVLTNSEVKTRRRCARLHHLRYGLLLRPIEDVGNLVFGDLFHVGLEAWWGWHKAAALLEGYDFASEAALEAALAAVHARDSVDPFDLVRLEELLRGYHYRWSLAMRDYEVIGVELEFRAALINPLTGHASRTFELGGKLDVLVRERSSGRVVIVEHKTSSEDVGVGSTYWLRLRMDSQVSTYFGGAAALGFPAAECLYDVIGKPSIRPSKATPMEAREYTKPKFKQCPECKRKPKKGEPPLPAAPHSIGLGEDGGGSPAAPFVTCEEGETPDAPRRVCTDQGGKLYANMRAEDETPEEFRGRLRESIASEPEKYYQRGPIVRLEEELRDHDFDIWAISRALREDELAQRAPKNPDSCVMWGRACGFFEACSGSASLDDRTKYEQLTHAHQELAQSAG